jgi:hypothetical protein
MIRALRRDSNACISAGIDALMDSSHAFPIKPFEKESPIMTQRKDAIPPRERPDHRDMGAQSDFTNEEFVANGQLKAAQREMVQKLLASGVSREDLVRLFSVPDELFPGEPEKDE